MLATELIPRFADIGAKLLVEGVERREFRRGMFRDVELGGALPAPGEPEVIRRGVFALRRSMPQRPYELDIINEGTRHESFRLRVRPDAPDFRILQARRDERHLLLYAAGDRRGTNVGAERLLCGHDERHWFVAAVAEPVSTVMAARRALLPPDLRHKGLNKTTLTSRHNDVFVRQGEWFFVPVTDAMKLSYLNTLPVHSWEPIQRGVRAKAHRCEFLVREGGTSVVLYMGKEYASEAEVIAENEARGRGKQLVGRVERRTKDMKVYVRGKVSHPDHATIVLDGWHMVLLNGEIVSSSVTFYD